MIRRHSNPLVLYIIQTHINVYKCTLKLTHTELSDIHHNISNTHTHLLLDRVRGGDAEREFVIEWV